MIDPTPRPPPESHLPESEALASTPSGQLGFNGNTPLCPESTHYEAEYSTEGDSRDVVSHDPHLNSDGSFFSIEYCLLIKVDSIP